jgi:hypothetical protein
MPQPIVPAFLFSQSPWTTVGILVGAILLLYFARSPAHRAIKNFFRVLRNAMRLASISVIGAEKRLVARNKEVLLATGMEAVERAIEREFHRVNTVVERDLQGYPAMNRTLSEAIARIDLDYRESGEVPPVPPAWIEAVEGIAKIPDNGSNMVKVMLADIHKTLVKDQKETLKEYRKATANRHSMLSKMMPSWRKIEKALEEVGKHITSLQERAKVIDLRMQEYEGIRRATDKALRVLSSSSMTQFFISGFVLLIAIGGAIINFNLIALPMSEMVGAGARLAGFQVSEVAALVIILIEVAIGLYLMEALRITRLFPIIGSLDDKLRIRLAWTFFIILTILACIESSLAFMRDIIAADRQALLQSLADSGHPAQAHSMIPTIGQMIMGFILPFALTFVAVPLESFVHSSRTVLGIILVGTLRAISFILRLFGNVFHYSGSFVIGAYDLIIFLPLWCEEFFLSLRGQHASGGVHDIAQPAARTTAKEGAAK